VEDAMGDGYDDNGGEETDYDSAWAYDNGVNGFECDDCDEPWYISLVGSDGNGQHGISLDASVWPYIDFSDFVDNDGDGIRVQSGSNNGLITDNDAVSNGGCDLRESGSTGNVWEGNDYGTRCGTVPAH
jgi:hypothetical protein